jgi:glycosyltransferase involved in cell wall biosynthesis
VNTTAELTIVIPAKNESRNLPRLLTSLSTQDYPQLAFTRVFVADADSTDGTPEIARSFRDRLDVEVIHGGLPSVGRNAGAMLATTKYVLFVDADIELRDRTLLRRAMETLSRRKLHCLTTNIWCPDGNLRDHALYVGSNLVQYFASWTKPFATGMFMLFDRERFNALGGFNEKALYAEDYLLSKQVSARRFGIVRGSVATTNRRFQKMGHMKIVRMFLKTAFNTWNESYFLRDHHYWTEA